MTLSFSHLDLLSSSAASSSPPPPPPTCNQGILLKLNRSGDDGDKAFLLLEPGSRFHLTSEPPERPDAPSGFALKLRKHLRSRRLEGLRQLGADRLVDLSFGSGENFGGRERRREKERKGRERERERQEKGLTLFPLHFLSLSNRIKPGDRTHHLLLGLHSAGNICLTDADYRVLTLLRSHKFSNAEGGGADAASASAAAAARKSDDKNYAPSSSAPAVAIAANRPYPIGAVVRPRSRLTAEVLRAALLAEAATGDAEDDPATRKKSRRRRGKKAASNSLKALLARAMPHGPAVAEHVAIAAGLDPGRDVSEPRGGGEAGDDAAAAAAEGHLPLPRLSLSDDEIAAVLRAAAGVEDWIDRCEAVVGEAALGEEGEGGEEGKNKAVTTEEKKSAAIVAVEPPGGYLTAEGEQPSSSSPPSDEAPSSPASPAVVYDTFEAFPLAQHEGEHGRKPASKIPFQTFDATVDEYFSKIARQREAAAARARDAAIAARGERIASDQARRAEQLQQEADDARAAAESLEASLGLAEEAVAAVVGALASGARWDELERTVRAEAAAGNPVAARVASLDLKKNRACLWLPRVGGGGEKTTGGGNGSEESNDGDNDDDEEEEEEQEEQQQQQEQEETNSSSPRLIRVDVDLSLTAHANAAALHQRRRAALLKLEKTREGHARAAAAAAASADARRRAAAASAAAKDAARAFRPPWFQKFDWFLTSEGYLVLCGRDSVRGLFFFFENEKEEEFFFLLVFSSERSNREKKQTRSFFFSRKHP